MSAWNAAQRQAASARMQAHKPWLKATGPKTAAGKSVAKMNAYKHGHRSAAVLAERRAAVHYLRVQKEFLKQVRLLLRAQRALKKSSKPTNEVMTHRLIARQKQIRLPLDYNRQAYLKIMRAIPQGAALGTAQGLPLHIALSIARATSSIAAMPSTDCSMPLPL